MATEAVSVAGKNSAGLDAHRGMHLAERAPQLPPDPVTAWRADRLRHARFSAVLADTLAGDRDFDLHALLELTDRGCPPELAARILAPLPSPTKARP